MRLALDAGTTVRADRLLDDLWAGAATRRNTLQSKVATAAAGARRPGGDRRRAYPLACRPGPGRRAVRAARRRRRGARLDAGDEHGAARAQHARRCARFRGELLPAAGDWAAPHRAQLEEARAKLLETQLAARLRLGEAVIGELEAAVAARALPRRAVGAADHRALPRRPPGRRAGRLPARPRAAGRRPRARARPARCRSSSARSCSRTPRCTRRRPGNLPSLRGRARRPRRGDRGARRAARAHSGSSRSSARAASARRRSRSRPGARCRGTRLARAARGRHDRRRRRSTR